MSSNTNNYEYNISMNDEFINYSYEQLKTPEYVNKVKEELQKIIEELKKQQKPEYVSNKE
jgi:hypothetical protein